ncbi:M14 family metallopeptidase [Aegicerativicinus sediminis]|uniref:M14 family metallopeptidase n=1 Tax=Aegicerativicinus sediminis TaxID=2893202 RepID=UPI001E629307|nr:M14 family metallopeptidase [Aegicerativicinus sediminis]
MKQILSALLLVITFQNFGQFDKSLYNTSLEYYLPNGITYNSAIPTPESIIGHEVGEWHVTHDKLVQYMYTLAEASDRITIENRGATFEGRPILLLTITSPDNHKNLESIRTAHIANTEGENNATSNMPIVVYQGFSIHGNEPSGANAALLAAYHLAAAESQHVKDILNNAVILFDPSFNPDGLQRFSFWANSNKSNVLNPDPNDREYDEVWPRGRTNHYWFDLNRDWLPIQLPESQARIKTFHKWLPNILTDHHEMGTNSSFFFQPGIPERTHPLTPSKNQELTAKIGTFHAKAFDQIGSLYYTEEDYDDFYYGKGSTFPDINGSIGILFEQASSRGHLQESSNGVLTFPFTIRNQFTAALSTLEAAFNMREELLQYQKEFFDNSRKSHSGKKGKAIVFGDPKDASKSFQLAEIMKRQNIEIYQLKQDVNINGKQYKNGYSYVVPFDQKNATIIDAMFDIRTTFKDSLFYDISAWTFPYAFDLDFSSDISMASYAGEKIAELKRPQGSVRGKSSYGYVMSWHDYYAPRALYAILAKDLRAKVSLGEFKVDGKDYGYGTIFIPAQNQNITSDEVYTVLTEVAKNSFIHIDPISTGLTQGVDLGSRLIATVEKPKVGILVGDGISSYDAGEIWHLFDQRYRIPLSKLDTKDIGRMNLDRYNVIIMPTSYNIEDGALKNLKSWVENGGTLIAYKQAINVLTRNEFVKVKFKKNDLKAKNVNFALRDDFYGAQGIGGAIFEAKQDLTHPINFGYNDDKIALFRDTTIFMEADDNSFNNPIQYTKTPLLSGYISKPNLDSLAGTVPFKVNRLRRGKVILFTDNTNFRAFWYGTNKLLMNAVFFNDEM